MKKRFLTILFLFFICSSYSFSQYIPLMDTRKTTSDFAKEVGSTIWFNPSTIAEGYGVLGFSVSVSLTSIDVNKDVWKYFSELNTGSTIYETAITVRKGITDRLSLGFRLSDYSDINANSWAVEAKYVFLKGSTVMPALSGRITYSKLTGAGILDANTLSAGIMVSKGFLNFTPYCGVALVRSDIDVKADTWGFSEKETSSQVYAGVRMTFLPMVSLTGEVSVGEITKYSVRAGIRF